MIARVLRIDRDDRQMSQVLARGPGFERKLRHAMRLVYRFLAKFVRQGMFVDGDQAEAARRERIPEHRIDPYRHSRRPSAHFAQHEVAGLGVLQLADVELTPFLLVDWREPETIAFLLDHSECELGGSSQFFERMRDPALSSLLGPGENPVANPERATPAALKKPQSWRLDLGVPFLGHRENMAAVVDLRHPKHRDLWHTSGLVKGAAPRMIDQPLIGHFVEQALEVDLGLARKAKCARDLALPRRLVRGRDEIEDLLSGR